LKKFWFRYFAGVRWIELLLLLFAVCGGAWFFLPGSAMERLRYAAIWGAIVAVTYLREPKTAEHLVVTAVATLNPTLAKVLSALLGTTDPNGGYVPTSDIAVATNGNNQVLPDDGGV
jgi:hypothetical protein